MAVLLEEVILKDKVRSSHERNTELQSALVEIEPLPGVMVVVRANLCKPPLLFAGISRRLCLPSYAFVPPPAVGKTGILLFQTQLGSPIISSCTIDLVVFAAKV
jgi:hypothetical protein